MNCESKKKKKRETEYFTCQGVIHVEAIKLDFLQMQAAIDEDSVETNEILTLMISK